MWECISPKLFLFSYFIHCTLGGVIFVVDRRNVRVFRFRCKACSVRIRPILFFRKVRTKFRVKYGLKWLKNGYREEWRDISVRFAKCPKCFSECEWKEKKKKKKS